MRGTLQTKKIYVEETCSKNRDRLEMAPPGRLGLFRGKNSEQTIFMTTRNLNKQPHRNVNENGSLE